MAKALKLTRHATVCPQKSQGQGQGGAASHAAGQRPPSSEDSTSGCFSSRASCGAACDLAGLVVSLQLRRPEVLFAPDVHDDQAAAGQRQGLLLRTEVTLDYNRHSYRETLSCSLASLRVSPMSQSVTARTAYL